MYVLVRYLYFYPGEGRQYLAAGPEAEPLREYAEACGMKELEEQSDGDEARMGWGGDTMEDFKNNTWNRMFLTFTDEPDIEDENGDVVDSVDPDVVYRLIKVPDLVADMPLPAKFYMG